MSSHSMSEYDAFGMLNLANAITTNVWDLQDNAILSDSEPAYFANSLELLKSIDFNSVDIVTIAYGTNDFTSAKSLATVEDALRNSIETIKNKYPNIDIVICSPTYRFWMDNNGNFLYDSNTREIGGAKLTEYIQLYKDIASEYGLCFIDNYNGSGICYDNRTECFPSTDGTHPNETGRQMIAENMAKELYKQFG